MVTGKEGTVSTASLYCRYHLQRLRVGEITRPDFSRALASSPRILRSVHRLRQNHLGQPNRIKRDVKAKIAAFLVRQKENLKVCIYLFVEPSLPRKRASNLTMDSRFRGNDGPKEVSKKQFNSISYSSMALSHNAFLFQNHSTYGLKARAGTSPPFFPFTSRAPP